MFPPKTITQNCYHLPERIFTHFPHTPFEDLKHWFIENNLYYDNDGIDKTIGLAHVYNWIFGWSYKIVDEGGAYRYKNPVNGRSQPPNQNLTETRIKYHMNKNLIKDAYKATQHPKFIRNLAKLFIEKYFHINFDLPPREKYHNYASVHFRFNPSDFFGSSFLNVNISQENPNGGGFRGVNNGMSLEIQKTLKNSTYFLDKLCKKLDQIIKITKDQDKLPEMDRNQTLYSETAKNLNKIVYIASPTNIADIFPHDGEHFAGYKIYNTLDMQKFLESFRKDCWVIDNYFGDVLSTLEKEMMVMANIFFRARPSNWSFKVWGSFGGGQKTIEGIWEINLYRDQKVHLSLLLSKAIVSASILGMKLKTIKLFLTCFIGDRCCFIYYLYIIYAFNKQIVCFCAEKSACRS